MLNKIKTKLKKNTEIVALTLLIFITVISTTYYNYSKKKIYKNKISNCPGIFSLMEPIQGSINGFRELSKVYDVYILSTPPWDNPSAWQDKLLWVQKYLGNIAWKRLILSHLFHCFSFSKFLLNIITPKPQNPKEMKTK